MDWTANYKALMAGMLNNATGGLSGGSLAAQSQYNASVQQTSQGQQHLGQLGGITDAAQALSVIMSQLTIPVSVSAVQPPSAPRPSVETIEHKPRVIELESEDNP